MQGLSTPESGTNDTAQNIPAQDEAAVEAWFRLHRERLVKAITIFIGGDMHRAEDICQEVFVKCLTKAAEGTLDFRGDSDVYTWLYSMAHNRAIDHHRLARRRQYLSLSHHDESMDRECGLEDPSAPNGLQELLRQEVIAGVRRVVDGLNEADQAMIRLVHLEGRNYQETAEAMQIPPVNLKRKLFNSRGRLHKALVEAGLQDNQPHAETRVPMRKRKRERKTPPRGTASL